MAFKYTLKLSVAQKRLLLLCIWIAFIWGHSLIAGPASSAESGFVVKLLQPLLNHIGISSLNLINLIVRKAAHFLEYAVLGALGWRFAHAWTERKAVRSCFYLVLLLVPVLDETIQLFVPGRVGALLDVGIDSLGYFTGLFISMAASHWTSIVSKLLTVLQKKEPFANER